MTVTWLRVVTMLLKIAAWLDIKYERNWGVKDSSTFLVWVIGKIDLAFIEIGKNTSYWSPSYLILALGQHHPEKQPLILLPLSSSQGVGFFKTLKPLVPKKASGITKSYNSEKGHSDSYFTNVIILQCFTNKMKVCVFMRLFNHLNI